MPLSVLDRLLDFDRQASAGLQGLLAGVDEAGRGPLAGPVVAAAVVLHRTGCLDGLNDSKQVSPQKREALYSQILQNAAVGIGVVEEDEIDRINIYQASRLAMKIAVFALNLSPALVLTDGTMKIDLPFAQRSVIKGDAKSASIAAASIIAKVIRDARMCELDLLYPGYGFKKHKGYGTAFHLARLKAIGPSPIHRKSFAPVANWQRQARPNGPVPDYNEALS